MTSPANLISLSEDDYLFYDDGLSEHMLQNGSEVGDPHGDSVPFVEFITEGVLLIIISILGFVGNALSIYVLLRPTLRGIFSNILMGLASFDALFLVCAITTFGLPTVSSWYKKNVFLKIMPVSYGLTHLARVGSVFATLSVTLERFFAIVFPFKDVDVVKRWLIPSTVIFTIVYNVPKFFEVTTEFNEETNETEIVATTLRQDPIYTSVYVVWSKLILTDLVPYFIILVLNSFIVVKIVKSSKFRAKILESRNEHQTNVRAAIFGWFLVGKAKEVSDEQLRDLEKQRQEHKLGVLLVGISILFICCQSFKIIPDVYEILFCPDSDGMCVATPFIEFCVNLSHLLVCFNSAANFVIYLLGGEKFRRAWCQTYLCRKADNPRTRKDSLHPNQGNNIMLQTFRMSSMATTVTNASFSRRKSMTSNKTMTSMASTNTNGQSSTTITCGGGANTLTTPLLQQKPPSKLEPNTQEIV